MKKLISRKLFFLISFSLVAFSGFAQTRDVNVIGIVPFGEQEIAFLEEVEAQGVIYKTSPFNSGELNQNEIAQISNTGLEGQVKVSAEALTFALYAELIENINGMTPPPFTNMPVVENEILFFQNEGQVGQYFVDLNNYMDNERFLNEDIEDEDKLDNVESYFINYTSYRKAENSIYDWENNVFTDAEIEEYMTSTYLNDDVIKTLFNEDRLIGIGDRVHFIVDHDLEITVDKNDLETIEILRDIENKEDFDNLRYAIHQKYIVRSNGIEQFNGKGSFESANNLYLLETSYHVEDASGCNPKKKRLAIEGYQYVRDAISQPWTSVIDWFNDINHSTLYAAVTVDWGDGTFETYSYNGGFLNHTYANGQTYDIQVTINFPSSQAPNGLIVDPPPFVDGQGIGEDIKAIVTAGAGCINDSGDWVGRTSVGEDNNGTWKMTCKVWSINVFNHFVYGSYTHAWKKIGSKWKRRKCSIRSDIDGNFRDDNCVVIVHKNQYKHNTNDKKVKISIDRWLAFGQSWYTHGDVNSYHYLFPPGGGPGSELILSLTIVAC
jgi:hypothetical protein